MIQNKKADLESFWFGYLIYNGRGTKFIRKW